MLYRLDELAALACDLGMDARRVSANRVDVALDDATLVFLNYPDDDDTLVAFEGTSWHAHGVMHFVTRSGSRIACDELEILVGLSVGELLVASQYMLGKLADRWLAHRDEPVDVRYIAAGEEIRVARLSGARRGV